MQKKNNLLNVLLLVLIFVVVAVMLYLTMSGRVELKTGVLIIFICVLATTLALYLIGAKNSAYGGRFKHNYPDAKNK
ncbi:hypothetical protein [Allobaculum stercoricanis]|uniref:hypothetical protein n=1 Tax=Allobaculum stercoricanis TaxID=174709 RepID=UPI00248E3F34|nr:hypothetical protein [Allobaculum stercoricanis]